MASHLVGKQAVVVGAGVGGLTAARALAEYFEQLVVLERDTLPPDPLTGPERRSRSTFMGCWPAASAHCASLGRHSWNSHLDRCHRAHHRLEAIAGRFPEP
jgi:flavin-dependent dehydrogenase